jgi:putative transcriptional regulator
MARKRRACGATVEERAMSKTGTRLVGAAHEALAIARGEGNPTAYKLHLPPEIDVKELRRRLGLTQQQFATAFGFSLARLRDWEQGRSRPDGALRSYLRVIEREPKAVRRALETS